MCFSAGASFAGGAIIAAIGVATAQKVIHPSQKLFASIPVLFSFQQFSEGILWLTLKSGGDERLQMFAAYFFLFMALVAWPTLIPLSIYRLEKIKRKRRFISIFLACGIVLSAYYSFCLIQFNVYPQINQFHIMYSNDFPERFQMAAFAVYLSVTIAPLFLSSVRRMKLFGTLVFISCLITGVFYAETLTSVWCFFAALISVVIYWIVSEHDTQPAFLRLLRIRSFNSLR
jgi:drug/metabolite transporter (DMT)-like permease